MESWPDLSQVLKQPHNILLLDELQFMAVQTWTGNNINLILKMLQVEHIGISVFILLILNHTFRVSKIRPDLRWSDKSPFLSNVVIRSLDLWYDGILLNLANEQHVPLCIHACIWHMAWQNGRCYIKWRWEINKKNNNTGTALQSCRLLYKRLNISHKGS